MEIQHLLKLQVNGIGSGLIQMLRSVKVEKSGEQVGVEQSLMIVRVFSIDWHWD